MEHESNREQLGIEILSKARKSDEWFEVAASRPFFDFDLSNEEAEKAHEAAHALSVVEKAIRNPRFSKDGELDFSRGAHVFRETVRDYQVAKERKDKEKVDMLEETIVAIANLYDLKKGGREGVGWGIGNVLEAINSAADPRIKAHPEHIPAYLKKIQEKGEPDEIYLKAWEFIKSKIKKIDK